MIRLPLLRGEESLNLRFRHGFALSEKLRVRDRRRSFQADGKLEAFMSGECGGGDGFYSGSLYQSKPISFPSQCRG